jgi:hypothetical protein
MKSNILLDEVAGCLSFALKQASASGHPGLVVITKARAKTLLQDIRAAQTQNRKLSRLIK